MFECFEFENGGKRNGGWLCIKYRLGEAGRWGLAGALLMISALSFTEQSEHFYTIAE